MCFYECSEKKLCDIHLNKKYHLSLDVVNTWYVKMRSEHYPGTYKQCDKTAFKTYLNYTNNQLDKMCLTMIQMIS